MDAIKQRSINFTFGDGKISARQHGTMNPLSFRIERQENPATIHFSAGRRPASGWLPVFRITKARRNQKQPKTPKNNKVRNSPKAFQPPSCYHLGKGPVPFDKSDSSTPQIVIRPKRVLDSCRLFYALLCSQAQFSMEAYKRAEAW